MRAKIVVGLGFGDEGKGITTDYLCQKSDKTKIVVRFSGGQQAGHNVVIAGENHVHSNYGSGTLRGVPSYFSEHCTVYPLTTWREKRVFNKKGIYPTVTYHPLTMVTTPFDVMYNRYRESIHGHGTCGLGISATIKRNQNTGYKLYAIDLSNQVTLAIKLQMIFEYYKELFTDELVKEKFINDSLVELEMFNEALHHTYFDIQSYDYLRNFDEVIFEGSQGIMLDMDHGIFPNVTRANTTSKNALEICREISLPDHLIEIYYVTRCYQTRHGAGWMSSSQEITLINTEHEINVFNEWQKDFKVRELDYSLLNYAIGVDRIYSGEILKKLVVTCLDQRPEFRFESGKISVIPKDKIIFSNSPESVNMTELF